MLTLSPAGRVHATLSVLLALVMPVAAALAAPAPRLLDCPLRDAALSVESPFIDVLLNPTARAMAQ